MDVACNPTTRNEDKHMKTDRYVSLDVDSVAAVVPVDDGIRSGVPASSSFLPYSTRKRAKDCHADVCPIPERTGPESRTMRPPQM